MSEWHSVETAPRDGRELLMTDGETVRVCYPKLIPRPFDQGGFDREGNAIVSRVGDVWEYFRDDRNAPGHTWSMVPTHWQELPEMPK